MVETNEMTNEVNILGEFRACGTGSHQRQQCDISSHWCDWCFYSSSLLCCFCGGMYLSDQNVYNECLRSKKVP